MLQQQERSENFARMATEQIMTTRAQSASLGFINSRITHPRRDDATVDSVARLLQVALPDDSESSSS